MSESVKNPAGKKDAKFEQQEIAALARIEELDEADKLHTLMLNARRMGSERVAEAAFDRRIDVLTGDEHDDPVTEDFWRSIHTIEAVLTEKNGKATRLTPTRQKLTRAGTVKTLADIAVKTKTSDGSELLLANDRADATAEAVILRHPDEFDEKTRDAATARLEAAELERATEPDATPGTTEGTTDG